MDVSCRYFAELEVRRLFTSFCHYGVIQKLAPKTWFPTVQDIIIGLKNPSSQEHLNRVVFSEKIEKKKHLS